MDEGQRPDIDARWALVLPLREHMLAVARRRCTSDEDAEDCVHEAMLRVVGFADLDHSRVEALLTSITTRVAVDMHRARQRAHRYQPQLLSVPEQQAPPDEAVLDTAEAHWLASRIAHLPERERAVFRQRAAGYTAGDAAARLNLSYKAVESAFTRARARMRVWAAAGTLLVLDWLRRLRQRQRPNLGLAASIAVVSAGALLATALPHHVAQAIDRPSVGTATSHDVWLGVAAPVAAHVQPAAVATRAVPSRPKPAGPPPPTPSPVPQKTTVGGGIPETVKKNSITLDFAMAGVSLPNLPLLQ
jgi:RNA polymerase sigma-70 factor (ECF subfamily)